MGSTVNKAILMHIFRCADCGVLYAFPEGIEPKGSCCGQFLSHITELCAHISSTMKAPPEDDYVPTNFQVKPPRGKGTMTDEGRQRVSDAAKKRWARLREMEIEADLAKKQKRG